MRPSIMSHPLIAAGVVAAFLWPEELKGPGAFLVGDWRGAAQYQDMRFALCEMFARRDPWVISVGIDRNDKPMIGFEHKSLDFKRKSEVKGRLHIGPGDPGVAIVLKPVGQHKHRTRAYLPPEAAQRLAEARHFRLTAGEVFADFELGSIRNAWPELQRCVATRGSR